MLVYLNSYQLTVNSDPDYTSTSPQSIVNNSSGIDLTTKFALLEERLKSLEDRLAELTTSNVGLDSFEVSDASDSASESANLAEATQSATTSSSLADNCQLSTVNCELNLTPPDILLASGSAHLVNLEVKSDATISGTLTAYQLQTQDSLKVFGNTSLSNTNIAGDLTVDGTLSIETGNTINVMGTDDLPKSGILYLQTSSLAKGVDIFNGKVTIDKNGKITVSTIQADKLILTGSILGTSKIAAESSEITIETSAVTEKSKVFVTPQTDIDTSLFVSEKTTGQSFKVKVKNPAKIEIIFDWMVVDNP